MMTTRCQDELALPKSPAPDRPFLIRYMAQERGPELENAPGFILQSWVQKQQQPGPSVRHPEGREKRVSRETKIIKERANEKEKKGEREREEKATNEVSNEAKFSQRELNSFRRRRAPACPQLMNCFYTPQSSPHPRPPSLHLTLHIKPKQERSEGVKSEGGRRRWWRRKRGPSQA